VPRPPSAAVIRIDEKVLRASPTPEFIEGRPREARAIPVLSAQSPQEGVDRSAQAPPVRITAAAAAGRQVRSRHVQIVSLSRVEYAEVTVKGLPRSALLRWSTAVQRHQHGAKTITKNTVSTRVNCGIREPDPQWFTRGEPAVRRPSFLPSHEDCCCCVKDTAIAAKSIELSIWCCLVGCTVLLAN